MHSRREFLQYGVAAAACLAAPLADASVAAERAPLRAIVDRTLPHAAVFAAAAALRGARVQWVPPDLGAAWMNDIEPSWRRARSPLIGFTRAGALFCLELFARDYGRGVVHRTTHTARPSGGYAHVLAGCYERRAGVAALTSAGDAWVEVAARLAVTARPAARSAVELLEIAVPPADAAEPLYSWCIAAYPRRVS